MDSDGAAPRDDRDGGRAEGTPGDASGSPGSRASDDQPMPRDGGPEVAAGPAGSRSFAEQVSKVPMLPGVYLWKNGAGEVIYVGKAKQLRSRMYQYIAGTDERVKIPFMMEQVRSFEYIVTGSEYEALVLEKNLIGQYKPYYNVDFRDDKSYPYIAIVKGDRFPAIKFTREKHVPTTRYFGPYTDARAARNLIDVVRHVVPICSSGCSRYREMNRQIKRAEGSGSDGGVGLLGTGKACFDYNVGLGPGPCCGQCTEEEYAESVEKVERFLSGQRREFTETLRAEMREAADDLDFEKAARIRNRLEVVENLKGHQHAVLSHDVDCDVFGFYREETITGVNVFVIREGAIINSCEFVLDKGLDVPSDDLIETFLVRYYDDTSDIPREVLVPSEIAEPESIESWLTAKLASPHGAKVRIKVPQRGDKHDLLALAEQNAKHALQRFKIRTRYDESRINDALLQLESALALPAAPMRIECYDISTIHGRYSVASMVVFTGGRADTSQYRRFKIRMETPEANDVAMMRETIERRFSEKNRADERFAKRPDLVILDGGKPQLNAVVKQLGEMGISDIPLVGLAKADEELFVTWQDEPVRLPLGSSALYLVKAVRDEAHRFAITYHRKLRGKGMTASALDDITGLGPKRKKALLKEFGSVRAMIGVPASELARTKGVPLDVAEEVEAVLAQLYPEQTAEAREARGGDATGGEAVDQDGVDQDGAGSGKAGDEQGQTAEAREASPTPPAASNRPESGAKAAASEPLR